MKTADPSSVPVVSLEVRARLVEALKLDLVGPGAGHPLAEEKLKGWERPSNWYLTDFLVPAGTKPEKAADLDEDDDFELVPESAGPPEESAEERKAAKRGFFPSSMGLSFLVAKEAVSATVVVRWGDYKQDQIEGADGKPLSVWQRRSREEPVAIKLKRSEDPVPYNVPGSEGLQLQAVERLIVSEDLEEHIPPGTRAVSVFLVNHRKPQDDPPDLAYVFQAEIEVRGDLPFVPRPDLRGARAEEWDDQVADLHYADTPEYAKGHAVSAEWELSRAPQN